MYMLIYRESGSSITMNGNDTQQIKDGGCLWVPQKGNRMEKYTARDLSMLRFISVDNTQQNPFLS